MMTWLIGQIIIRLTQEKNLAGIRNILDRFSQKQRESIMSEKINRTTLLYIAIQNKSAKIVNFFLKECGANANYTGYDTGCHCPCLWKASELNDLETVKILLRHGADIDGVNSFKTTAIYAACSRGNLDIVRFLWRNGADVNSTNHEGVTCLMASIEHPNLCRYLIGVGTLVNTVNVYGDSAIILAIKAMQKETVTVLLDAGANPFFINHYGINAIFLITYMNLEICPDFFESIYQNSKNCIAIAFEVLSCQQMVTKSSENAYTYWEKALKLRELSVNTRIYRCPNSFHSDFQPILSILTGRDAQVLKFIEFRLGVQHPFTLDLFKCALLKINRIENYIFLFRFFIRVIKSSENELFFEMSQHIDDMVDEFKQKYSRQIDRSFAIMTLLADYLEDSSNRIDMMKNSEKLAYAFQIDACHNTILRYTSIFAKKYPSRLEDLNSYISRIVKLGAKGKKHVSLLHFCIQKEYSVNIFKMLVRCGANVNVIDENGKKPVHYALMAPEYNTKEIIDYFLQNGLRFDENSEEDSCLPCLLEKNNLLENALHYTTLQCLAAKMVAKNCAHGDYLFSRSLQIAIHAHSKI